MFSLWNYILECVRLLYWIYFKPYTLKRWLQNIHPDLKPDDNPYIKLKQFPHNKSLRRYADQVFFLTAITPQLAILLVGFVYTAITQEHFAWYTSEIFLMGWIIGQIIFRLIYRFFDKKLYFLCLIALGMLILVAIQFLNNVVSGIALAVTLSILSSAAWGVISSVALGITSSVILCLLLSVDWSIAWIIGWSVAWGIALSVVWEDVFWNILLGVLWGIGWSFVASPTVYSVIPGVVCILAVLRVYFWLPELFWMCFLFLFTPKGRLASKMRYLPPYFDQLIHLPLPFMSSILVETYQEKPNAVRQTINYLTNSTNQQSAATKSIVNIVLDTLERCHTLGDIIDITEELAWISSPYPAEIRTIFPQFLDISHSVHSISILTSVYRQIEILKQTIKSLSQIQKSNALIKNPYIANVSSNIAEQWLSILETARGNLQAQTRYAQEIPQVYIAGVSLDPETAQNRFKGRHDLFREIENIASMSPPPTLLLYGNRRTGKTSTLKYLPQKVGRDFISLRVDVQGIADAITLGGVVESLVEQIIDSAKTSRNLNLSPPDREELQADPFPTLRDWLTTIEQTAPGKRFLLCLDEFERLEEVVATTNSLAPLNFLRHVIQDRASWILLFTGSHTLDEMENYWSDYLISTRYVRLTYLEKPEAEELITHPVPDFPNIYLPEAVEKIIYWTRCQPFLVQLLCSELVDYLNRKHRRNVLNIKVTAKDVESIIPQALVAGSLYFNEFWYESLNSRQRESIKNLIQEAKPTSEDRKIWRKLVQKEILEYNQEGGVGFQVPLIKRSIIQKIKEDL